MPSLSSSNKLYSLPSGAVLFKGALHIHKPLVQGLWVGATTKPLLRPSNYIKFQQEQKLACMYAQKLLPNEHDT